MAEGRSNTAITNELNAGDKVAGKHINSIFTKLGLPPTAIDGHRRVRAVLMYLRASPTWTAAISPGKGAW
ncbi:hypothetical protein SAMN05444920_109162 [Nonomuraea solani]|uniref:Regulatory protein, luxR family n=1 Tax=Nonomuraea solani TaxID=1144553 RepID=A0A1H6EG67_9ACTN|nr:response regulator transcription factor [Nonomuraea solani]SEG95805.1 hypothetical protein SAMN05444920_109162 [Nonomuraea solani]